MKKLKYIFFPLIALFVLYGCSEDPIDRRLSSSDFFVTFETNSGVVTQKTIYENDPNVITITMAATAGAPVDVTFDVILPEGVTGVVAEYELLTMNNTPMTSKTLTFENGTGSKSFKFVGKGGDGLEGSRTFSLVLKSNSAGYQLGYAMNDDATVKGGDVFPVTVIDDIVIEMEDLLGTWTVTESLFYGGAMHDGESYSMTVAQIGTSSSLTISGIAGGDPADVLTAIATLETGTNKFLSIPAQDIVPSWDETVITHFCALSNGTFANNIGIGFTGSRTIPLMKIDGVVSAKVSGGLGGPGAYSYVVLALDPSTRGSLGAFTYAAATTWVKD